MAPAAPSQRGCSRWSGQDPACPAPSPPPKWLFGPVHIALSISEPGRVNVLKVWFRQREARGFPGMEAAAWRPGRRMCGGLCITPALERARWGPNKCRTRCMLTRHHRASRPQPWGAQGPLPSPPAPGGARSQPLAGEEGRTRHPTLFLLGGHMPQGPPRAGAFRPSVRTYKLWLLH